VVVQQSLSGLLGDKVKSNTLSSTTSSTSRTSSASSSQNGQQQPGQGFGPGQQGGDAEDRMRRFMEFREMMRQGGRDGGGRDGGGGRDFFRGRDGGGERGGRGRGGRD
jgi:hypothetical protein